MEEERRKRQRADLVDGVDSPLPNPPGSPLPPASEDMCTQETVQTDDENGEESEVDVLKKRLAQAVSENARLREDIARLEEKKVAQGPATLSPAVYTVHGAQEVRRMRLGRTASIATKNELNKLAVATDRAGPRTPQEYFQYERLNSLIKPETLQKEKDYLSSKDFAKDLIDICKRVSQVFKKESRVLEIESPLYIFGDLHGNLEDLAFFAEHVFPLGMRLSAGKFLFLGDYVDRGQYGLELLAYLFAQKLQMPDKVYMIRGNHEIAAVNSWEAYYGSGSFLSQCKARFGDTDGRIVWQACNATFDYLPLASIIDGKIFGVHGGICAPLKGDHEGKDGRIQAIRNLPVPLTIQPPGPDPSKEDPHNALAFSLLWADPADQNQEDALSKGENRGFGANARGGGTVIFGNRAVLEFLEQNKLDYIIRAHEATASGVAVCKNARVLTVFSTSKDHGFHGDAKCGCCLVDRNCIQAITRSASYEDGSKIVFSSKSKNIASSSPSS